MNLLDRLIDRAARSMGPLLAQQSIDRASTDRSRRPVQLSVHSRSSLNQYSAQYSFQATDCFPVSHCRNNGQRRDRNESCRNDYHQSPEVIVAEQRIEPATSFPKNRILYATE